MARLELAPISREMLDLFEGYFRTLVNLRYDRTNRLGEVIHYILSGEGKKIRAILCLLGAKSLGSDPIIALNAASAIEMIHAYSLVHDDLPCMDDDDLRRNRPTAHRAFDEARALLAGDALLTDAFLVLTSEIHPEYFPGKRIPSLSDNQLVRMVKELSRAAGSVGMVQGQILDLYWTGQGIGKITDLNLLHNKKTGCLIGAACALGALAGGATMAETEKFKRFGLLLGLSFQIVDDLLDDSEATGKSRGKDLKAGKLTYLTLMSRDDAKKAAKDYADQAIMELTGLGHPEMFDLCKKLVMRTC